MRVNWGATYLKISVHSSVAVYIYTRMEDFVKCSTKFAGAVTMKEKHNTDLLNFVFFFKLNDQLIHVDEDKTRYYIWNAMKVNSRALLCTEAGANMQHEHC